MYFNKVVHMKNPDIKYAELPTNNTPIPYPNRPIASLILALGFFIVGLIPGVPAWLGIGYAMGIILDDQLSWFPINILNAPRAFRLKRKRIKTTLRIFGGYSSMVAMYLANNTIWNISNHPLLPLILHHRASLQMGVLSYALAILAGIIILKLICRHYKLNLSKLRQVIFGMLLGQFSAWFFLPSSLMLNSLALDVSFFSVLTAGFVGALTVKLLCQFFYWACLGHSNADGWCYQNQDHWLSKKLGWRASLAANKKAQWQTGFKALFPEAKPEDIEALVESCQQYAVACRQQKQRQKIEVFKNDKLLTLTRYMKLDPSYRTVRNAPLDCLANVHDRDSAYTFLAIFRRHKDGYYWQIEWAVNLKHVDAGLYQHVNNKFKEHFKPVWLKQTLFTIQADSLLREANIHGPATIDTRRCADGEVAEAVEALNKALKIKLSAAHTKTTPISSSPRIAS